jgi:hypothetical protein
MKKCSVLFMLVILTSCATERLSEEEYRRGQDGVVSGPGLFSGEKGGFDVEAFFSGTNSSGVGGATAYDVDLPAMDQKSFEEYERFKAWRRTQQPDSAEFKEYQEWLEYRRSKVEQGK